MSDECPFCGEEHDPGPTGEPGSMLAGIVFRTCPRIPDGCFYVDQEFEVGPRGSLHRLRVDE